MSTPNTNETASAGQQTSAPLDEISCPDCDGYGAFSRDGERSVYRTDPGARLCSRCHGRGYIDRGTTPETGATRILADYALLDLRASGPRSFAEVSEWCRIQYGAHQDYELAEALNALIRDGKAEVAEDGVVGYFDFVHAA